MTLIIENPNADEERTTRTPGRPCRLTVSGYVTWSSISCGERPGQSENTITWLSDRSGIASSGVVSKAQYPHAPSSAKTPTTRKRFRSDSSMSRLITDLLHRVAHARDETSDLWTDYGPRRWGRAIGAGARRAEPVSGAPERGCRKCATTPGAAHAPRSVPVSPQTHTRRRSRSTATTP